MQLTPLYELLILIEDKREVTLDDLKVFNPAILRGILGKMEAMKLVSKTENATFRISEKGQDLLNSILDNLHEGTLHWDNKWRFISFSIPESKRPLRDKFRRQIESVGLKMILTGLWITPLNIADILEAEARKIGISKNIVIIESEKIITGITQQELKALWNFESSKEEIYKFIRQADEFLNQQNISSYEIKKMIFRYAMILNNQPKLPIELFPSDWPQFRANLIYKKIKRLLTK